MSCRQRSRSCRPRAAVSRSRRRGSTNGWPLTKPRASPSSGENSRRRQRRRRGGFGMGRERPEETRIIDRRETRDHRRAYHDRVAGARRRVALPGSVARHRRRAEDLDRSIRRPRRRQRGDGAGRRADRRTARDSRRGTRLRQVGSRQSVVERSQSSSLSRVFPIFQSTNLPIANAYLPTAHAIKRSV